MSSIPSPERKITSQPRNGEMITVETPTTIHALLEFANGAVVTLGASWDVKAHGHRPMELYGTEASLVVPDPNFFGGKVELVGDRAAKPGPCRNGSMRSVSPTSSTIRA
jgi:predicted dehydrogenase